MNGKLFFGAIAIIALSLVGTEANASLLRGSYSGTVDPTPRFTYYDHGNLFGQGPNANLGGERISGTFVYDASGIPPTCDTAGECNYFGVFDRITAKIAGHTLTVVSDYISELALTSDGLRNEFDLLAINDARIDIAILVRTFSGQFFVDNLDPNSLDFSVHNPDQYIGQLFLSGDSGFNFSITRFDVDPVRIPEPSSLVVFACALGMLGVGLGKRLLQRPDGLRASPCLTCLEIRRARRIPSSAAASPNRGVRAYGRARRCRTGRPIRCRPPAPYNSRSAANWL